MKITSSILFSAVFLAVPPLFAAPPHGQNSALDSVLRWNKIAIDASGYDHAHAREQLGPGRASRAMAIVHIAIFDAANAISGDYESYGDVQAPKGPMSAEIAVAVSAHDTLAALFPSQAARLDSLLAEDLASAKNKNARANGTILGKLSAFKCLLGRANDGSQHAEPFMGIDWVTSDLPGHWSMDPISQLPIVLGGHWSDCAPFVLESSTQFRIPPPPAMTSPEYAAAYNEVKRLGGDGVTTPTERTPDQSFAGVFWAYDGTPSLCAPPRLFNQIVIQIADQMGSDAMETARLLALVNIAMSDATLTCWESKYYYDVWRPVTAIRRGVEDGNAATAGDPGFKPLGAPASNLNGPNFTPPFPAYPSGHASMGGALFQTLRRFYGTDNISFTFVSDEYNGETKDNTGAMRARIPRTFANFSQAEEENGQSRIYLGIHYSFDKVEGIAMGRQVANYVYDNVLKPVSRKGR